MTLFITGNASLEGTWRKLGCAEGEQPPACTPKRHEESAPRFTVTTSLSWASREDAECVMQTFMENYEIKTHMIGEAADPNKLLQVLNKTARWISRGLWSEHWVWKAQVPPPRWEEE